MEKTKADVGEQANSSLNEPGTLSRVNVSKYKMISMKEKTPKYLQAVQTRSLIGHGLELCKRQY